MAARTTNGQMEADRCDSVTQSEEGRLAGDEATLATVDSHYGALRHLFELCREHGIDRAVPDAFDRLFQAAVEAGHGQDDFASLIQVMRHRVPSLSSGQGMTQEK
jgi:3-hydroxyisobutyrate dehydrogenase-like beta-hydroxyacid dehydrogenase